MGASSAVRERDAPRWRQRAVKPSRALGRLGLMPIATPDQYAEMLDTAKKGGFAFAAVNVSSSSTINAVLQGLTEAGSDGIIQVTTGGADYFAGQTVKARASGALAFAAFATEVAKNYPITVALHTDHCPKDALDGFVLPAHRGLRGRGQGRPQPDLPVAHVGRLGRAARREHRDREGAAAAHEGDRRDPRGRDRRRRRRGGRRQPRDQRAPLHDAGRRDPARRRARPRRAGPLHGRPDLRQRARRLQARQRGAEARAAERDPGWHPGQVQDRPAAARPGLPRRIGIVRRGDRHRRRERRHQDEHRHRHPVRLQPLGRRHGAQELRRLPQGRRRGRQQEGLRPARLGQARRDRDGGARRRGDEAARLGRQEHQRRSRRALSPAG